MSWKLKFTIIINHNYSSRRVGYLQKKANMNLNCFIMMVLFCFLTITESTSGRKKQKIKNYSGWVIISKQTPVCTFRSISILLITVFSIWILSDWCHFFRYQVYRINVPGLEKVAQLEVLYNQLSVRIFCSCIKFPFTVLIFFYI